jgi:hypothetical protein
MRGAVAENALEIVMAEVDELSTTLFDKMRDAGGGQREIKFTDNYFIINHDQAISSLL